ncbi:MULTISPECIES: pyrroline-5-carboxylate reductase [Arthrobacter]|uniref:pyrroline-5-carboxylate reductase n=1 Tax=Arthrobacter TaxID=1663 RepID=UPI0028F6C603|nr:pyrroline-5-carboxylate reductase [Arthrobacter sp. lap29]
MMKKIVFLGCGSMGEAILAGMLAAGVSPLSVVVTVRRPERANELAIRHGVTALASNEESGANAQAVEGASVVILGVKPVGITALCQEIAGSLESNAVVISVAAAVSLAQLEGALRPGQPVVRSMPNTPLKVGRGVVALSAGSSVDEHHLASAHEIFDGSGVVLDIAEDQQNAVSAISGSGPAYAFYLAEAMAAAAQDFGLSPQIAHVLARETVAGAGMMLAEPGANATELRRAVTSPKGTTEQAIASFDREGLPGIILKGAQAAAARAAEITKELSALN